MDFRLNRSFDSSSKWRMTFRSALRAFFTSREVALPCALCVFFGVVPAVQMQAGLRLNEVMASNGATISDEDGDFEDWIELYNASGAPIDLSRWGLSDDLGRPFRWTFPEGTAIDAGAFLLVWASGKNRSHANGPLHTNFSLDRDGEPVVLTKADGTRIDIMEPRPIPRDISVGRLPGGGDEWYYFTEPSPGAPNEGEAFDSLLSPPSLSHAAGFFDNSFDLVLSHPDPDAKIIYTFDGSVPRRNRLDGVSYVFKNTYPRDTGDIELGPALYGEFRSNLYAGPLRISDRSAAPNRLAEVNTTFSYEPVLPEEEIFKGTVVRAKAVRDGAVPSAVVTRTYFVHPEIFSRYSVPVVSISLDEDAFIGYEDGIYVPGKIGDAWKFFLGDEPWFWWYPTNYNQRGRDWERPAHIEVFDPAGGANISQDIGIRVHGGRTRGYRLKSLRLYSRNAYGSDTMDFPLFPGLERRGVPGAPLETFRRLILRNAGNDLDQSYYRDAFMQELVRHLGLDGQAYRPAVHFINGEYWGLINFRERLDVHYLQAHYGLLPEDVAILSDWESELIHGEPEDRDDFLDIVEFAEWADLSRNYNLAWIAERVDLENLVKFYAVQVYVNNLDWPQRNNDLWRKRVHESPDGPVPPGHDGRWRWFLYDLDFGFGWFGDHTVNSLARVVHLPESSHHRDYVEATGVNRLFRALVSESGEFRDGFVNTLADLINSAFQPGRVIEFLDNFEARINRYRAEHNRRWAFSTGAREEMRQFAKERPAVVRGHIAEVFGLLGWADLTVVADKEKGSIRVNSLELAGESTEDHPVQSVFPWTGVYFQGVPVELEAMPREGFRFLNWRIHSYDENGNAVHDSPVIHHSPEILLPLESQAVRVEAVFEPLPAWARPVTLHAWEFEDADNVLAPSYTVGAGSLRVDAAPPAAYLWNGPAQGFDSSHLRINDPLNASVTLDIPTAGYEEIQFAFETRRSGQGAGIQEYQVSADGINWSVLGKCAVLNAPPQERIVNLQRVPGASDNDEFALRIRFGQGLGGDSGNNRFDRIFVTGRELRPPSLFHRFPGSRDLGWGWKSTTRGVIRDMDYPWVYFGRDAEWLKVMKSTPHHLIFWSPSGGAWFWSTVDAWPFLFEFQNAGRGNWWLD